MKRIAAIVLFAWLSALPVFAEEPVQGQAEAMPQEAAISNTTQTDQAAEEQALETKSEQTVPDAQQQQKTDLYLEGKKGNFKLKPGTVYHWRSTPDGTSNGESKYYRKKLTRDFIPTTRPGENAAQPAVPADMTMPAPAADINNQTEQPEDKQKPDTSEQPAAPPAPQPGG